LACGDGDISPVLIDAGYEVDSTDLIDRGFGEGGVDCLEQTEKRADAAVANPPFALDDEFALHAIKLGIRKFALLCRLTWLEGVERYQRLFSQYKLARVWVFSARQTLWRGDDEAAETDGGQTCYAWFVFELDHSGPWTLAGAGGQPMIQPIAPPEAPNICPGPRPEATVLIRGLPRGDERMVFQRSGQPCIIDVALQSFTDLFCKGSPFSSGNAKN
jgi:hypothetical protein